MVTAVLAWSAVSSVDGDEGLARMRAITESRMKSEIRCVLTVAGRFLVLYVVRGSGWYCLDTSSVCQVWCVRSRYGFKELIISNDSNVPHRIWYVRVLGIRAVFLKSSKQQTEFIHTMKSALLWSRNSRWAGQAANNTTIHHSLHSATSPFPIAITPTP